MNKISKSYKCCILCLKSPLKVPDLKLHRFPTNEEKKNVWLNDCGLKIDEYSPNRRLCSRHIDESSYNKSGSCLKLDAISTKYLKGQIVRPFFQLSEDKTINFSLKNDESTIQSSTSETVNFNSNINESNQTILSLPSTTELQVTPKREKRFIGEIKTPDFDTPQRARKSFKLAENKIKIQKNKIKILNQKVRRLKTKLSSLQLLLSHLKQKNLLSEEAHDNILHACAIHLEAVSNLSAQAFLAALRRFFARRGQSAHIHSDNGTNFHGASAELSRYYKEHCSNNKTVIESLATDGTEWHFNPPSAPHMGGLWKAAVKSTKHHLLRITGSAKLNFEELTTMLCQIEACLNSRPLTSQSSDPESFAVLTPAHFLVGGCLTLPPELQHPEQHINYLK
ncbi:uncharacterized protein LOC126554499 [Aphis gossypii]|uniref:uncharacterized protein LOC126554499 n=1 Tax=Aphis gossypii TaxID=80765 RepID=UPI0021592E47|nr:uncharacterized protein LOC126554499 [Aphis gossypii]